MAKPLITVFSQQPIYTAELPSRMAVDFDFQVCESLADVEEVMIRRRPSLFIADCESPITNGHLEDQLLTELCKQDAQLRVLLITRPDCKDPLLSRGRAPNTTHLTDGRNLELVIASVNALINSNPSTRLGQHSGTPDGFSQQMPETTLMGISRGFQTRTPKMAQTLKELEIAARHDVTVLLVGETGCGKTFLSRLLHEVSPRRNEPFLHVACGALPQHLLESELFGHVKGAFTSAHIDKDGKFLAAGRGTILLDEIDVLDPEQQVKLLKVIETGEFEPVGSNRTFRSEARLIVASNLHLQPLVEAGRFRPDLYYRLNMLKFEILPLRDRLPDLRQMTVSFVEELSRKHDVQIQEIEPAVFDALLEYPWPGNVRELENVIQRAIIFCEQGRLTVQHLPSHVVNCEIGPPNDPSVSVDLAGNSGQAEPDWSQPNLNGQIQTTEKEIIKRTLLKNSFSRTNTARELGISRVTLYNKMKKYDMFSK